jgi:hypothetical protein
MQQNLFGDPPKLNDWRADRDKAMQRAEAHAAGNWKNQARVLIELVARTGQEFCGFEVTEQLRAMELETPSDRALGPLLVEAAKRGLIYKTGEYRQNPIAHGCPSPVWKGRGKK